MKKETITEILADAADLARYLISQGEKVTAVTIMVDGGGKTTRVTFGHAGDSHCEELTFNDCTRLEKKMGIWADPQDIEQFQVEDDGVAFI